MTEVGYGEMARGGVPPDLVTLCLVNGRKGQEAVLGMTYFRHVLQSSTIAPACAKAAQDKKISLVLHQQSMHG